MKMKNSKFYFLLAFLLISCIISWNLYFSVYQQEDTVDINLFPKQISNWSSDELIITEDEYAILETRNAFARRYFNDQGQEVQLFIVYSQNNRKVSHPPEICYTGNGISVINHDFDRIEDHDTGKTIKSNKLLLEQHNIQQISYYWFKVGDSFTPNYWKQQGLIALKTLIGRPSSSALIRISTFVKNNDVDQANSDIKAFASRILSELPKYLP